MQILPPEDIATLRSELAKPQYKGLSDLASLDMLYTPSSVPNPIPQGKIPKRFAATDLTVAIDPARKPNIVPLLGDLAPLVHTQDREQIGEWGKELVSLGLLQASDLSAIAVVLGATIPDPNWQATVPGPTPAFTLFGGKFWPHPLGGQTDSVQIEDIAEARK